MISLKKVMLLCAVPGLLLGIQHLNNVKEKIEVNIGYQSITAQTWGALIIKEQQILEKKLKDNYPKAEIHVNWYDEASGSLINNNMIAHKYQIGYMGDMACIVNLFNSDILKEYNSELIAFDGKGDGGINQSILVSTDSEIKSVKNLEGKTISVPIGSSAHRMLLEILKTWKVIDKVNIVYQDIPTACNMVVTGKVDAVAAWEPYPTMMQLENKMNELVSGGETGNSYLAGIVVDTDWVKANKQIFDIFVNCVKESHEFLKNNIEESIKIISDESNFSSEVVAAVLNRINWEGAILPEDKETLQEDCDFLVDMKEIEEFPISKYIKKQTGGED